jgi:hypothetical protein
MMLLIPPALRPADVPPCQARGAGTLLWLAAFFAVAVPFGIAVQVLYGGWAQYLAWASAVGTMSMTVGILLCLSSLHVLYGRQGPR